MILQPKVSVIIPVYGVEKYIERCARSLFEQTLHNIEFLFIDDCTPDNSILVLKSVLEDYPSRIPQVKIFRMPHNSGQIAVRKFGIEHATGEYIIHCDSDDWVDMHMYEKLYNKASAESLDIVICDYCIANDLNEHHQYVHQNISLDKNNLLKLVLREEVHGAVWNKLIKSTLYKNIIEYPKYNLREDLCLIVQLIYYSNSIGYINDALYYYYFNSDSISKDVSDFAKLSSKYKESVGNFSFIEAFLAEKCIERLFRKELESMKYRIRISFIGLTYSKPGFQIWSNALGSLPIANLLFLPIPFMLKVSYILAVTKIHYYFHFLRSKFR